MFNNSNDKLFQIWLNQEKLAVNLVRIVGELLYDKSIELVFFRNHLIDVSISEILQLHKYANDTVNCPVNIEDTCIVAQSIIDMDLAPSKLDIGLLAYEWTNSRQKYNEISEFLEVKIGKFKKKTIQNIKPRYVVLYGFGRIGRLIAREIIKQTGKGQQLRLKAIVTRSDDDLSIVKRAALLRNDSVYGRFYGTISENLIDKSLVINGQKIKMIKANTYEVIDYTKYGIENAILIDNTGIHRNKEDLNLHLKSKGISKVILTAPGKEIPNIVYGINQNDFNIDKYHIFSAASCTTNAISPILKVINDELEIVKGHIETIHAYTNDQNLLDNMHDKPRRGRSAAINMVITSTGAGKAIVKVIPNLDGKLTANAVRVPTPNGSLAILSLSINKETTIENINALIKKSALKGDLVNQIYYSADPELVSNDIIGNTCCSVYDSEATIVHSSKKDIVLYVWYDNEFGYIKQVIRLTKHVAQVKRNQYY